MAGRICYHCKQRVEEGEAHDCWTTTEAALTEDLSEDLQDAWQRLRETAVGVRRAADLRLAQLDHVLAQVLLLLRAAEEAVPRGLRVPRAAPCRRRRCGAARRASQTKIAHTCTSATATRSRRRSPTGCAKPTSGPSLAATVKARRAETGGKVDYKETARDEEAEEEDAARSQSAPGSPSGRVRQPMLRARSRDGLSVPDHVLPSSARNAALARSRAWAIRLCASSCISCWTRHGDWPGSGVDARVAAVGVQPASLDGVAEHRPRARAGPSPCARDPRPGTSARSACPGCASSSRRWRGRPARRRR